ncbi:MAG TPA: peptidoglycan-binding domain-containing protein [Rhodopila sp.]
MKFAAIALCSLGVAGAAAAVILATAGGSDLSGSAAAHAITPTSTVTPAPAATPASPATPAPHVTPAHHLTPAHPATPAQTPSATVENLQRQLGQLNYYEGADNGIMTPATVQAIQDLQREAGLPQTGVLNAASDTALIHQLTFGNSQMGGGN